MVTNSSAPGYFRRREVRVVCRTINFVPSSSLFLLHFSRGITRLPNKFPTGWNDWSDKQFNLEIIDTARKSWIFARSKWKFKARLKIDLIHFGGIEARVKRVSTLSFRNNDCNLEIELQLLIHEESKSEILVWSVTRYSIQEEIDTIN